MSPSGRFGSARVRSLLIPSLSLILTGAAAAQELLTPPVNPPLAPITLLEAQQRAMASSPTLKSADARIRAEEGRLDQAGAFPNPELALEATRYTSGFTPRETFLTLLQPLPWHGKRDLEKHEAAERIEAAKRDRERERLDLLLEVRESYYRIFYAGEVLKVEEEDLEATRAVQKAVNTRVDAGDAAPFESLKASVELQRAESGLEIIRGEIAAETASFNLLLGLPTEAPTVLAAPDQNLELEESLPELQTRALASQPEIQSRQHAALAAGYAAERAHLEPRPDIAVGPMIGTDTGATFAGIAMALKLPLWNRNRGGVAAAAAGRDEAEALVEVARLSVSRLVANSYGLYRAARMQQAAYEHGLLSQTAELVDTARKSYEGGESGLLDYLDARRTALAVRKEYYRASLDAVVAALRLRRAVGDDSEGAP